MWNFFGILSNSFGSLLIGIVASLVVVVLALVLIRSWQNNRQFTPMSYLIGAVLGACLAFQFVCVSGALTVRGYCDDLEQVLTHVEQVVSDGTSPQDDPVAVVNHYISSEWPLLAGYVEQAGDTAVMNGTALVDNLRSDINYYLLCRAGWSMLFLTIGIWGIARSMERPRRSSRGSYHSRPKIYDD